MKHLYGRKPVGCLKFWNMWRNMIVSNNNNKRELPRSHCFQTNILLFSPRPPIIIIIIYFQFCTKHTADMKNSGTWFLMIKIWSYYSIFYFLCHVSQSWVFHFVLYFMFFIMVISFSLVIFIGHLLFILFLFKVMYLFHINYLFCKVFHHLQ